MAGAEERKRAASARILVVDDNPEIREILGILLGGEGYDIDEAKNGSEAVEKTEKDELDLIILDIMMPGMNGYQTCREIRKNSNAPILFLGARTKEGEIIDLIDTEYALLYLLIKNRRQIFSAQRIYEAVWGEPYYYGANNTVMVHIRNLRRKIEPDPKNPTMIKTLWGRGYRCD